MLTRTHLTAISPAMIRTHGGKELAVQDIEAMDKKINQSSTLG
jgi:hypothetical protein